MNEELVDGTPPGWISVCHPSLSMELDFLLSTSGTSLIYSKPSTETTVALILLGHFPHVGKMEVNELAKESCFDYLPATPHNSPNAAVEYSLDGSIKPRIAHQVANNFR
jgi:hypothetical protein